MALTTLEETQVKDLLVDYEGLKDLGADSADIIAALAPDSVTVPSLPSAVDIATTDVLYLVQGVTDTKATIQQLADAISPFISGVSDAKIYYFSQI